MRRTYTIGPLLKPFRLIYLVVISAAVSAILFNLGLQAGAALGYYLYGVAALFLLTALLAVSARYAVEIDVNTGRFTAFVRIFGCRIGAKTTVQGVLDYVLLSTVSYTDNNTPVHTADSYYTVYLVFDGVRKQEFIETTSRTIAIRLASELAHLLNLEFKDKTVFRNVKAG